MKMTLEEAKERLKIPELARKLGLPVEIPEQDGKTVTCWFPENHPRGDKRPSFNLHDGLKRGKCFSCGVTFDGPGLISLAKGISNKDAVREFIRLAEGIPHFTPVIQRQSEQKAEDRCLKLPADLSKGTRQQWERVAKLRGISIDAVELAVWMGVLRFGSVCRLPSWIILDDSKRAAEARRMDGKHFPAFGKLIERKAHTIGGSRKDWPVGILCRIPVSRFRKIVVCEGTPDLLAAYHFLERTSNMDALPVSMLGREIKAIHPEALQLFEGKLVRIFAHNDTDGDGIAAAKKWGGQIARQSATVDGFDFSLFMMKDGKPVGDLNDAVFVSAEHEDELLEMLLP